jgi:hypothetical protein
MLFQLTAAAATTYLAVLQGGVTFEPPPDTMIGAVVAPSCVADVWLTIGAGEKATVPGCDTPAVTVNGTGARVDGWAAIVKRNDSAGALADALAREGTCVGADGPYAALAAARSDGTVAEYRATTPRCEVQLTESAAPAGAYAITVRVPERLHLGSVTMPGVKPAVLTGTPKRGGLVTLPDVTRLLADVGSGVRATGVDGGDPADLDRLANMRQRLNGYWVTGLISFPLLVLIALGLRRRVDARVAYAVAAWPAGGFVVGLLPWWRWGVPGAWLAVLATSLALAGLGAFVGRALRSVELGLCAVVATAFAIDLVTFQALQRNGLASYSMLTGGRFYGIGNLGFAVFATAVAILCGAAARQWDARAWIWGFVPLTLLDGTSGYDFGGVVALVATAASALTRRLRTVAVAAVVGLGLAMGIAYADAQRDYPTHLGRFVSDGDMGETVARKGAAALHSVIGTWYPLLVAGCAVAAYLLVRQRRELHDTARVLAVLWVVGSLVNDSGIVVAGGGLALATPLLVSYTQRRA